MLAFLKSPSKLHKSARLELQQSIRSILILFSHFSHSYVLAISLYGNWVYRLLEYIKPEYSHPWKVLLDFSRVWNLNRHNRNLNILIFFLRFLSFFLYFHLTTFWRFFDLNFFFYPPLQGTTILLGHPVYTYTYRHKRTLTHSHTYHRFS